MSMHEEEPEGGAVDKPDDAPKAPTVEEHKAATDELARLQAHTATLAATIETNKKANEAAEEKRKAAELKRREDEGDILPLYETAKAALTEATNREKAMASELDALKAEKAARLEATATANADRVKALPEDLRALIPAGLEGDSLSTHLARLESLATAAGDDAPVGGRVTPPKKAPKVKIPKECADLAAEKGVDPDWYYTEIYKPREERKKLRAV